MLACFPRGPRTRDLGARRAARLRAALGRELPERIDVLPRAHARARSSDTRRRLCGSGCSLRGSRGWRERRCRRALHRASSTSDDNDSYSHHAAGDQMHAFRCIAVRTGVQAPRASSVLADVFKTSSSSSTTAYSTRRFQPSSQPVSQVERSAPERASMWAIGRGSRRRRRALPDHARGGSTNVSGVGARTTPAGALSIRRVLSSCMADRSARRRCPHVSCEPAWACWSIARGSHLRRGTTGRGGGDDDRTDDPTDATNAHTAHPTVGSTPKPSTRITISGNTGFGTRTRNTGG